MDNFEGAMLRDAPELLQAELGRRIAKNPKYSLRAFAKTIGLSPATLSLIIARKTPLSKGALSKISRTLGLTPEQNRHLQHQISLRKNRLPKPFAEMSYRYVTLDFFKVLSEWYYYAILSLLEIKGASIDPKWISKKLGISLFEAREAVERLQRLDLITEVEGRWKQSQEPVRVDDASSTSASRRFQKQLLIKALESLENDPVEVRDVTSMTFAMSKKDIPYAIEKIAEFRRKLTEELEQRSEPDSVYNFTLQLFPVTKEFSK